MRRLGRELWGTVRGVSRDGVRLIRRRWRWYLLAALAVLFVAWMMLPYDAVWAEALDQRQSPGLKPFARWLSRWGNFVPMSIGVSILLWLIGWLGRVPRLRAAAVACVLAASLGGAAVNVGRFGLGRPRPFAEMEDGFYGPSTRFKLHGFPSAHAGTSMGSATALLLSVPPLGVAAVVAAGGVAWSRIHRRRHHPTDVLIGGSIGAFFGLTLGAAARRRAWREEREKGDT